MWVGAVSSHAYSTGRERKGEWDLGNILKKVGRCAWVLTAGLECADRPCLGETSSFNALHNVHTSMHSCASYHDTDEQLLAACPPPTLSLRSQLLSFDISSYSVLKEAFVYAPHTTAYQGIHPLCVLSFIGSPVGCACVTSPAVSLYLSDSEVCVWVCLRRQCALYNFLCVCEFMHHCANLSLMCFFGFAGVSTAMCQICLLPLPLYMRESLMLQWISGWLRMRADRSSSVCVWERVCHWQASLYYPDWLRKCSSSHLAIIPDTEMTVSSWTEGDIGRGREKEWERAKEGWRLMEWNIFRLISMSKRAAVLRLRAILARHEFDACFWHARKRLAMSICPFLLSPPSSYPFSPASHQRPHH